MCSVGKAKDQPLVPGAMTWNILGSLTYWCGGAEVCPLVESTLKVQLPSPGSLLLVKFTETMETS